MSEQKKTFDSYDDVGAYYEEEEKKLIDQFFNFDLNSPIWKQNEASVSEPKIVEVVEEKKIEQPKNKSLFSGTAYVEKYKQDLQLKLSKTLTSFDISQFTGTSLAHSFHNESRYTLPDDEKMTFNETETAREFQRYRADLPIYQYRHEIIQNIQNNPVVLITGPTGCGKSTQVPQYIYDDCLYNEVPCNILISQPRKIAAITLAQRVAKERFTALGALVGYQVGLNRRIDETDDLTQITFCTTGVILQKLITEKSMGRYSHIILDEVHERDLDIDFLVIIVRKLLAFNSPKTKIVLMSATLDVQQFQEFFKIPKFDNDIHEYEYVYPPIIDLNNSIRRFQISERYIDDIPAMKEKKKIIDYQEPCITAELYSEAAKLVLLLVRTAFDVQQQSQQFDKAYNILVFLPGLHEIERFKEELSSGSFGNEILKGTDQIVILHSTLSTEEQKAAFAISSSIKIILSTNIAESAVTIPNVMFVVDFCLTKYLAVTKGSQMSTLILDWATKNNLKQRAGRAGRVCKGTVYRLVHKEFYYKMTQFPVPEIKLTSLESVVVKIKKLNMGSPLEILAISLDPPDQKAVVDAVLTLKEHGGLLRLDKDGKFEYTDGILTFMGDVMSALPCDIRVTRLILIGYLFSVLDEAIIIGAGLNIKGIFLHSLTEKMKNYTQKLKWSQGTASDCIAILNAYTTWTNHHNNKYFHSAQEETEWCKNNGLDKRNLNEMRLLIDEIKKRLILYKIENLPSGQQPLWHSTDKVLVLKIVLAGAFGVANFFLQDNYPTMEKDASRTLCDLNLYKTVYFRSFDHQLVGDIYQEQLKNAFIKRGVCDSKSIVDIKFDFQSSERIYVTFEDEKSQVGTNRDFYLGKVLPEVYKALKLRYIREPIELKVMSKSASYIYAQEMGLGQYDDSIYRPKHNYIQHPEFCPLPTLSIDKMLGYVTYVVSCEKFYFCPYKGFGRLLPDFGDASYKKVVNDIRAIIKDSDLVPISSSNRILKQGEFVIFRNNITYDFDRATFVEHVSKNLIKIHLTDRGEITEASVKNVYKFIDPKDEKVKTLQEFPARIFECRLKEIKPSFLKSNEGSWTVDAIDAFRDGVLNKKAIIEIFSIVDDVVTVNLLTEIDNPTVINWNQKLIKDKHAQECEESYNSKINHQFRMDQYYSEKLSSPAEEFATKIDKVLERSRQIPPPPLVKCKDTKLLSGPYSPLEIPLRGVSREVQGHVQVDGSSINQIVLNDEFTYFHSKFYVAADISYNIRNNAIKIRETTAMPNIPGLSVLLALMFCPTAEIHRDKDKTRFTSILTGLGYDKEFKQPYFEERDTVQFIDFDLNDDDINRINHIRFAMSNIFFTDPFRDRPNIFDKQRQMLLNKIKALIMTIIKKNREVCDIQIGAKDHVWNSDQEDATTQTNTLGNRAIFNFIGLPALHEMPSAMKKNLIKQILEMECQSMSPIYECKLCNIPLENSNDLKLHLLSKIHVNRKMKLLAMEE